MSGIKRDTARLDGVTMDYFSFGTGSRTFVILPGMSIKPVTDSAEAVAAAFDSFAADYTVYVFARSEGIDDGCTVEALAEDTAQVMRSLGIEGADVFGASQGGMMAMCIAAEHPELVRTLAVASTSAAPCTGAERIIREWKALALAGDVRALNRSMTQYIYSPEFREKYRSAFAALETQGTPEELMTVSRLADACLSFDIRERLGRIRCPVLAVGSEQDALFGAGPAREIAEACGGELIIYSGFGHALYDEAPDFRARLKAFSDR